MQFATKTKWVCSWAESLICIMQNGNFDKISHQEVAERVQKMINLSEENLLSQSIKFGYYLKKVMLQTMNRMSQIIELRLE